MDAGIRQVRVRKQRSAERRRSAFPVRIRYMGELTRANLYDISTTGAAFDLVECFKGAVGSRITIESEGLSALEGRIRWLLNGRIGVEFDPSSNSAAKVNAYFKFFHRSPSGGALQGRHGY